MMASQSPFDKTNPFSFGTSNKMNNNNNNNNMSHRPRGTSLAKAPPRPPSAPPSAPPKAPTSISSISSLSSLSSSSSSMGSDQHLRQQLHQYQNMYKQTKNQLEVLKSQFRGQEKELSTFKSQKHLIDSNHSNIISWQKKISELESEKERLIDKNGLFLQQKNQYLLQLADQQQMNDEFKVQIDSKTAEIDKLETELTNSSQNFTQQLSKKDNKYKSLKVEYQSLSKEYMTRKKENQLIKEELNAMAVSIKEMKQENILLSDKYNKLLNQHDTLKVDHQQIQTQIC